MPKRRCLNCPHWQKNGDCYRVIHKLIDTSKYVNRFGYALSNPYDPHDVKYLYSDTRKELHKELKGLIVNGVNVQAKKIKDVVYDDEGGERIGSVTIYFCQTSPNYTCEEDK